MDLYDKGLKWRLAIYYQLKVRAAILIQVRVGLPIPTKIASQFLLYSAWKRGCWRYLQMLNTRADNSLILGKKIHKVSYDNDHKDIDFRLRATEEGVLFSCPHHFRHVHMIVRKHPETSLVSLRTKGLKSCGSKILITSKLGPLLFQVSWNSRWIKNP